MFPDEQAPTLFAGPLVQSPLTQQEVAALEMHAPLAAQVLNAGATQEQTPVPVQVRLPPQDIDDGGKQFPLEQDPMPTRLTPEHVGVPQAVVLPGKLHVPLVHVPLQVALLPVQSLLPQQEVPETHAPVVGQTLFGETHVHTPAPVQLRLLPQATPAGKTQVPVVQVPAPMRLPLVAQLATPQLTVGYEHVPLVWQIPPQGAVPPPMQSVLLQQFAVGMQAPLQGLKFAAQLEHRPAPEQVKPLPHAAGAGSTQVPLEQAPVPMRLAPEQLAVPQVPVGYEHVPLVWQVPPHVVPAPAQSLLVQHEVARMHALAHILKPPAHGKLQVFAVPHTPVVLAGPPVQSALVQHPAVGMHRFVLGHSLKPVLHAIPQVPAAPPVQVAAPLDAGTGQDAQLVPQNVVLVSGWQMPLQLCCPDAQTPLQAFAVGMQPPRHSFIPAGHVGWHARPSQVTVPPLVGTWQGMHDASSLGPQVATALLSTHLPPHT